MEIELTRGEKAIIDEDDFNLVSEYNWHLNDSRNRKYAATSFRADGRKRELKMHRLILGCQQGVEVDHINGNGLDNRRSNLRVGTHSSNMQNRGKQRNNTSGFKGVTYLLNGRWRSKIRFNKHTKHLGYFNTSKEAASAYDKAALTLHGEFAYLNNPFTNKRGP